MANVSVEKSAVSSAISLCNQSIQQFNRTSKSLSSKYQEAGAYWKDVKYKQLGGIVNDCTTALNKPVKDLEDCITKLNELLKAIEEYEATNL